MDDPQKLGPIDGHPDQAPSRGTQRHVLIITSVASLLVGLDALVVSTAVTTIRQDLGASPEQLQWMVNSYTLTFAVLLMPAAALGERCQWPSGCPRWWPVKVPTLA
jgi:predicted MFS family arabinose efflux permease